MRHLRNPRLWFGAAAVVVGVVVGLLTNIVTTTPTWPIIGGVGRRRGRLGGADARADGR